MLVSSHHKQRTPLAAELDGRAAYVELDEEQTRGPGRRTSDPLMLRGELSRKDDDKDCVSGDFPRS